MRTLRLKHSTVLDPEKSASPSVVVYGGLYGWEGAWLVPQIPSDLQKSVIFILPTHFHNDCNVCLTELHTEISPEKITSYSLCGYSRGGIEVYRYRNLMQWKILGLIDPSAPTMGGFQETVLDNVRGKIRCVYWVPNWGKDGYAGKIPSFAAHLRALNVNMLEENREHRSMPSFFFNKFQRDLLN